jgi:hypothetical protein
VSGQNIPVVKKVLVELTLGQQALKIWVFIANLVDDFIMGLDILRAYNMSMNVGCHMLRLVPVREAPTASVLKRSWPAESRRNSRPVAPVISGETAH